MSFKRFICACLSILTFAPLSSSQAMKECNIEMSEINNNERLGLLEHESGIDLLNYMNEEEMEEETKKLSTEETKIHNLVCPICYDDKSMNSMIALKCGHMYHQKCMQGYWDYKGNLNFKCPTCQQVLDKLRELIDKIVKVRILNQTVGMSAEDIREGKTRLKYIDVNHRPTLPEYFVIRFLELYYTSDAYQWGQEELECSTCDGEYGIIFVKRYDGNKEERIPLVIGKQTNEDADLVAAIYDKWCRENFNVLRDAVKVSVSGWSEARRRHYQLTLNDNPSLQDDPSLQFEQEPQPALQNEEENPPRLNDDARLPQEIPWGCCCVACGIPFSLWILVDRLFFDSPSRPAYVEGDDMEGDDFKVVDLDV